MSTVYIVEATDGVAHVVMPWGNYPLCEHGLRHIPATVLAVLDSGDVPLATTCADCVNALDELEAGW